MYQNNNICTFLIPCRIDSEERKRNLYCVINHLSIIGSRIIVLEADSKQKIEPNIFSGNVDYIYIEDNNPVFFRTHYINLLLHKAQTPVVSIWDTDIIIPLTQVEEAINNIENGCVLAYPYSGSYVLLPPDLSSRLTEEGCLEEIQSVNLPSLYQRPFCGGAFFVNRKIYLSIGGENENFTSWGPEDVERLNRVRIMGYDVKWTSSGRAYHLHHPRYVNSRFKDKEASISMRRELVKVCSMDKEEMLEYIKTFNHEEKNINLDNLS